MSPLVIGSSEERRRPSVIEGVAFEHDNPPTSKIVSLSRAGNNLFLRSAYID